MRGHSRTFFILALIMFGVAVLRWFMKGWMDSLGMPELLGSFLSSINIVVLAGMVIIFAREGRAGDGRYWRAGGWWLALAAWEQMLIIPGILLAARTGASTYYSEMVNAHRELPPVQHALSHAVAFVFVGGVGLLLGWLVYWVAKRGRQPQIVSPARS
jgi:hypothetical protein